MLTLRKRCLAWMGSLLLAGAIGGLAPSSANAQCWGYSNVSAWGWHYPSWGYAVGMPGYYSDFRAHSYYASPWCGYEAPWYSRGDAVARYPWIWNRGASTVVRGFVVPSPPPSIKVGKNPYYRPSAEAAPAETPADDAAKTTSTAPADARRLTIRVVPNPFVAASREG